MKWSKLLNPKLLVVSGLLIALTRIFIIQYHGMTGEKLIHPILLGAGFWLQWLLIGLGFGIWNVDRTSAKRHEKH